jgi:hypothetical protein
MATPLYPQLVDQRGPGPHARKIGLPVSASATLIRPNDTAPYGAADVINTSTSAPTVLEFDFGTDAAGATLMLTYAALQIAVNAIPAGMGYFKLHGYSSSPTAIADNAAFNLPSGDRAKHLKWIQLNAPEDLGDTIKSVNDTLTTQITLAEGSSKLYAQLETPNAYTPTASVVKTITLAGYIMG